MSPKSIEPATLEADARARWGSLEPAVWTGQDSDGRRLDIAPSELLAPILRRARLIAASDSLCEAVVAHLVAAGVDAEVDRVRADPRVHDDVTADGRGPVQVMALRAGDKLVPLRPGSTTLTIWPPVEGTELTGEPLAEITVTADTDRWVPAARIADVLKSHLS